MPHKGDGGSAAFMKNITVHIKNNSKVKEMAVHSDTKIHGDLQVKDDEKLLQQQLAANLIAQGNAIKDETEVGEEVSETEKTEIKNIETDKTGNPEVDIDGTPLIVELPQEVDEDFASKAQQKYLYAVNPAAAEK